ncbi:MAG TPA: hypothetical protein PKD86_07575 [Gemmatales bacterium]|nr:hypothetical protein [Gemmatales bacterium]
MPKYRMRALSGADATVYKVVGGSVQVLEIESFETRECRPYCFSALQAGGSINPKPISVSGTSSWTIFEHHAKLDQFSGFAAAYSGHVSATGKSGIKYLSGKPKGLFIDTSGWQVAIPGLAVQTGYIGNIGEKPPSNVDVFGLLGYSAELTVWRAVSTRAVKDRHLPRETAVRWGTLTLHSGSTYSWDWEPHALNGLSSKLEPADLPPASLQNPLSGRWREIITRSPSEVQLDQGGLFRSVPVGEIRAAEPMTRGRLTGMTGMACNACTRTEKKLDTIHEYDQFFKGTLFKSPVFFQLRRFRVH